MFQIVNFYKFVNLTELERLREELKVVMIDTGVRGTIILADEGFNAMLCGKEVEINAFLPQAKRILGCELACKSSFHEEAPLRKIDVKIKPEIVTLKQSVDISLGEGTHVGVERWNELISDPETVVLDSFSFSKGRALRISGTAPREAQGKLTEFSDELRAYTVNGQPMFSKVTTPSSVLRGPDGVSWNMELELAKGESE